MGKKYIIPIEADPSALKKGVAEANAALTTLDDHHVMIEIDYEHGDIDDIRKALDALSAYSPEIKVQLDYDFMSASLKQKQKELVKNNSLLDAYTSEKVGKSGLSNYISSIIDEVNNGLKNGISKDILADKLKLALDLESSYYKATKKGISDDVSDRLYETQDKLKSLDDYTPSDDAFRAIRDSIEKDSKIIEGLKLQLADLKQAGAIDSKDVIDLSDIKSATQAVSTIGDTIQETQKEVNSSGKIRFFDGVKEHVYDVKNDLEEIRQLFATISKEWGATGFRAATSFTNKDGRVTDNLYSQLKGGYNAPSLGSGTYFSSLFKDVSSWSKDSSHNRNFYAANIGSLTNMLQTESDEYLYELFEMFQQIHAYISKDVFPNDKYNEILSDIDNVNIDSLYDKYSKQLHDFGVSQRDFRSFIENQTEWLSTFSDGTGTIPDSLKQEESFTTKFFRQFTNAKGLSLSNLGALDSSDFGTVVWDNIVQSIQRIDFGDNTELAKEFASTIFKNIISNKAKNPNTDLDEVFRLYTGVGVRAFKSGDIKQMAAKSPFSETFLTTMMQSLNQAKELQKSAISIPTSELNKNLIGVSNIKKPFEDVINFLKTNRITFDEFFQAISDGADQSNEKLGKLSDAAKKVFDESSNNPSQIDNGKMNWGGIIGDDYVLISRLADTAADKCQQLIPLLHQAKEEGVNVGEIIDSTIYTTSNGQELLLETQKKMPGIGINKDNLEFLNATDEQIQKLVSDLQILQKVGLYIDTGGDNILYDKDAGFSFIDLNYRETGKSKNNPIDIINNLNRKVNPDIDNNHFFDKIYDFYKIKDEGGNSLDHIPQKLNEITSAGKEATQTMEQFHAAVSEKESSDIGSVSNSEVESLREQLSQAQADAEAERRRAQDAEEKAADAEQEVLGYEHENARLSGELSDLRNDLIDRQEASDANDERIRKLERDLSLKEDLYAESVADQREANERADEYEELNKELQRKITDLEKKQSDNGETTDSFAAANAGLADSTNQTISTIDSEKDAFNSLGSAAVLAATNKNILTREETTLGSATTNTTALIRNEIEALNQLGSAAEGAATNKSALAKAEAAFRSATTNTPTENESKIPTGDADDDTGLGGVYRNVKNKFSHLKEYINSNPALSKVYSSSLQSMEDKLGKLPLDSSSITDFISELNNLKSAAEATRKDVVAEAKQISDSYKNLFNGRSELFKSFENAVKGGNKSSFQQYLDTLSKLDERIDKLQSKYGNDAQEVQNAISARDTFKTNMSTFFSNRFNTEINESIDKIQKAISTRANQGSGYIKEYREELEGTLTSLQLLEQRLSPGKMIDASDIQRYVEMLNAAKQTMKGLTDQSKILTTRNDVAKLLGKVTKDIESSNLSGDTLNGYLELQNVLRQILNDADSAADGLTNVSKAAELLNAETFNRLHETMIDQGMNRPKFIDQFRTAVMNQSAQFLGTYFSLQDLIRYGREMVQTVTQLDSNMIELKKVSGETDKRLEQSFKNSTATAREYGATISDIIQSTADWSRAGYEIDEAEQLAAVTQLYQNVGDNLSQETASEYLISTMRGFQIDSSEATSIVDKMNEVANNFSIDTAGIGEALERSAASFYASGTSLDKSIALVTATSEITQDPASAGTMWKTNKCLNVQKCA